MDSFWEKALDIAVAAGLKLLLALVVLIIGRQIIKWILRIIKKGKFRDKMEIDATVDSFLTNFVRISLHVVLIVSIIAILGVPMASVVTVLATCGVAVGLALQGALSNVAGSLMILLFRPFNVGDYIASNGVEGTVKSISMFYTVLNTVDNKEVTIPNGALMNATVSNMTSEATRMVDLRFNITKSKPIPEVRETLLATLKDSDRILAEPAPFAGPQEPVSGGLQYAVRAWVKTEDYWPVYYDLMEKIPTALADADIGGAVSSQQVLLQQ